MSPPPNKPTWLIPALASGSCAAFNGAFAKLTTTELTTSWSNSIASALGLASSSKWIEYAIRGLFFACNLLFNAIMWALFTRALTLASSTVRVSIINTSANFMVTALLGAVVFSEKLPGLWWVGAGMLVVGSVVIGRREEGEKGGGVGDALLLDDDDDDDADAGADAGGEGFRDEDGSGVELEDMEDGSGSGDSSVDEDDEDNVLK